jgi:hypothetical protein
MAGYSAHPNRRHDERYGFNSPLLRDAMADPGYLANPSHMDVGLVRDVGFRDYLWLYARTSDVRHLILHAWGASSAEAESLGRVRGQIAEALVEDEAGVAGWYDLARLPEPGRTVVVPTEGWGWPTVAGERAMRPIGERAELAVYRPGGKGEEMSGPPVLEMTMRGATGGRRVRVRTATGRVLGEWDVLGVGYADYRTALDVPAGVSSVWVECDGEGAEPTGDRVWVNRIRVREGTGE